MARKPAVQEEGVEVPAPAKGPKPDFRVVQSERGLNGETRYRSVGGMWKKTAKSGKDFYSLGIGNLRLLVFPNKSAE